MCDDSISSGTPDSSGGSRGDRGGAAADNAGTAYARSMAVETDVEVETVDGVCDAVLFSPIATGSWPAVLIWSDVLGLRPVFRDMGRRLASRGYVVLVPNPFYRWSRAPVVEGAINLNDLEVRGKMFALAALFTNDGIDRDSRSFFTFLDSQPQTDTARKAGVHGYCMGGQFAFRSAAAVPARIGAVASFHGSRLVTDDTLSPHRLIARTEASYLVAIAENDDAAQPDAKSVLKQSFLNADRPAVVKVFSADHGWCVAGSSAHDEPLAEEAWSELELLYAQATQA